MKKLLTLLLALIMCLAVLTSCDASDILGYIVKPVEPPQEDVTSGIDEALAYLRQTYKDDYKSDEEAEDGKTSASYEVIGTIPIGKDRYTVTWTSSNEKVPVTKQENGLWLVEVDEYSETVEKYTLTATITSADGETRTLSYDRFVPKSLLTGLKITVVTKPVVGAEYYLMVDQKGLGQKLFFTGKTANANYYAATSETYTDGVMVKVLEAEGGYYLQFGGDKYINIILTDSGFVNLALQDTAATVFTWNEDYNTFTTEVGEKGTYYLGAYDKYSTIAASKFGYISTSYPVNLVTVKGNLVLADGEYTLSAGNVHIGALGETASYGYLPKADTAALFTVKNVAGGVTIQDSYRRFLYMSGTYNSFQLGTEAPADGSNIWKVTKNDDGTYTFVNAVTEKTMAYSGSYSSVGAYATVAEGNVSTFTLTAKSGSEEHTHNITDDNFTPEQPATCTSDGKKGHFYCEVCQKAFDREGNEIEDLTIEALGHDFNIWGDCSRCEHTEKVELKVYYKNTKNWENVNVWAWYNDGQNICEAAGLSWPGMPISKVEGTDDWYVASVNLHTLENIKFLFNGGNNVGQTQDVVYDATKLYMYNNTLYATQAEADAAYVADSGVAWSDLYIRGDMNNWGTSNQLKVNPDDESAYIEIDLIAGQKFKIATDTWSYEINWSFVQDTVNFEADGSDIKVVNSGTYTFVVSKDWTTLTITKKHTHEWGDGVVTTDPTCTTTGVRTFTCSCGETKTEEIPVDPEAHVWGTDFTEDKAATCTEAGSKSIHCTLCTATKDTTAIDALGHEIVDGKCTHEGCTVAVPTEEGKVTLYFTLGEDSVEIPDYAVPYITGGAWGWADWCVKGAEQFTHLEGTDVWYVVSSKDLSSNDEYKILLNAVAMGGHGWRNASTVHVDGANAKYTYVTDQKIVDLGAHGFSSVLATDPATVTNWVLKGSFDGWGAGLPLSATETAGVFETVYLDVTAGVEYKITNGKWASDDGGIEVVDPETAGNFKIETAGKYKLVFNVNTWTVTVVAEEHTHDWGDGVVTTDPTCTTTGVRTFTCSCGETKTEDVDALGHVDENGDFLCDREGCSEVVYPEKDSTLTVAQAIALAKAIGSGKKTTDKYYVEGTIDHLDKYSNFWFKLEDGSEFEFYYVYNEDGTKTYAEMSEKPIAGDTVKAYGVITNYNGTCEMKNAWIQSFTWNHKHSYTDVVTAPTCVSGYTTHTCACGHTVVDTYTNPVAEHTCDNGGHCSVCNRWVLESKKLEEAPNKGDVQGTKVQGFFTLIWNENKSKIDSSDEKTWSDGYTASQRINFGGKTKTSSGSVISAIQFTTTEATTVRIWWVSASNESKSNRQIAIYTLENKKLVEQNKSAVESVGGTPYYTEFILTEAGTYYLGPSNDTDNNYIFKVEVDHVHTWDNGTETTAPTCTAEGVKTFTCACGTTKTEAIAKIAHTYVDGKCSCGAEEPQPTTVTMKHSETTTSTNLDTTDTAKNAKLVGLDSTIFAVESVNNGHSSNVGLNKDGTIRLYSSKNDASVREAIKVSATGVKILTIKINLNDNSQTKLYKVYADNTEVAANEDGTYTINAASFTVKNAMTSTSANQQLWIDSIEIVYQ